MLIIHKKDGSSVVVFPLFTEFKAKINIFLTLKNRSSFTIIDGF